jgi:tripartite-type tricarboxylate transporter receptor subunit TctC
LMPALATLAESGLPGFDATLTYGLLAPAGTPRAEGGEPEPTTPEQHAAVIDREESKWSAVIRAAGIQAR